VQSDPEEDDCDMDQSEASSGEDPLFHDLSQTSTVTTSGDNASSSLPNMEAVVDGSQQHSTVTSSKPVELHSDCSSDEEPLATTEPRKASTGAARSASPANTVAPLDTATKAYSRPIQPVVDKHRSKKIQFLDNPAVKPKNYGLAPKPNPQRSSSKDSMSPVTSTAAPAPRGIPSSSRAPARLSPIQTDQPNPFADSLSPTFDLGPSSPTTLASPNPTSKNDTKLVPP
jgi:hypothetical protein